MADLRQHLQRSLGSAYELHRELSGGGMSRVFLAQDATLGRNVVVKVLPDAAQGLSLDRFEREVRLAASLQQANIVPLLSAGHIDGVPYYTMPFIEGDSLRARLNEGPLPIAEVVSILRDVSRALAYAHGRGIVHRDIKPDNILLSGGAAVVTDFGIAKAIAAATDATSNPLTIQGVAIGTPAYMSPEQASADEALDHRSDLYSLGCVAYELLTGRPPFAGRGAAQILAAHISEPPRAVNEGRADCPAGLARLVMQMLEKSPGARPQSAADVLSALGSAERHEGVESPARVAVTYVIVFAAALGLGVAARDWLGLPGWVITGTAIAMLSAPVLIVLARRPLTATRLVGGAAATFLLFGLIVTGYMTMRRLGIGPAASLLGKGAVSANARIVLADLKVPAADSSLAPLLFEAMRSSVSQSRIVRVVPPEEIGTTLREMRRDPATRLDVSTGREIGERIGAQLVLGGNVVRTAGGFVVNLELYRSDSLSPIASLPGEGKDEADLVESVSELTARMRERMGESFSSVRSTVSLERATTSSLEALRLYSQADRMQMQLRDVDRIAAVLRQAIALDSTFALAHRKLAQVLGGLGELAEVDAASERAFRYSERLPFRERLAVQGSYYSKHSRDQSRAKAIAAYRELVALDSTSVIGLGNLALLLESRREMDEALDVYRAYARRGDQTAVASLALHLLRMNRVAEADRLVDSMATADSTARRHAYWMWSRFMSLFIRFQFDSVEREMRMSSRAPDATGRFIATLTHAQVLAIRGRPRAALEVMARAEREFPSMADSMDTFLSWRGPIALAQSAAEGSISETDKRRLEIVIARYLPYLRSNHMSVVGMMAGDISSDRGPRILSQLAALNGGKVPPALRHSADFIRANAALRTGRYKEAIAAFKASDTEVDGFPTVCAGPSLFGIARAHDAANEPDSALAYYERVLSWPRGDIIYCLGTPDNPATLWVSLQRAAAIHDQLGHAKEALARYREFTALVASPEPSLQPAVEHARRRIAALTKRAEGG